MTPPPACVQARANAFGRVYSTSLWASPTSCVTYIANLDHIAVHNILSLLLLRNAPPDEVSDTILIVLCLYGLATSIGFCVNRIPHNK